MRYDNISTQIIVGVWAKRDGRAKRDLAPRIKYQRLYVYTCTRSTEIIVIVPILLQTSIATTTTYLPLLTTNNNNKKKNV